MKRFSALVCLALMVAATPVALLGSGSYAGRPPKPPDHIDAAKYELGKNLITGRITPTSQATLDDLLMIDIPIVGRRWNGHRQDVTPEITRLVRRRHPLVLVRVKIVAGRSAGHQE